LFSDGIRNETVLMMAKSLYVNNSRQFERARYHPELEVDTQWARGGLRK
jgi:hypothetical protein